MSDGLRFDMYDICSIVDLTMRLYRRRQSLPQSYLTTAIAVLLSPNDFITTVNSTRAIKLAAGKIWFSLS